MAVKYVGPSNKGGEEYIINNKSVYIYFPQKMSENSEIKATLYYPGNGNYAASYEGNALTNMYNNADNNIDFAFISSATPNALSYDEINELLGYVGDSGNAGSHHFNMEISDISGLSAGGNSATESFLTLLRNEYNNNSSVEPKSLLLYDVYGYGDSTASAVYAPNLSDSDIKLMEKNQSQFVFFTHDGRLSNSLENMNSDPLKRSDGSITRLAKSDTLCPIIVSGNINHSSMTNVINDDGWKLYFSGLIDIKDIKNNFNYTDSRTGEKLYQQYHVTIPTKDANGNVIWHKYELSELVAAKNDPSNASKELLNALNYVENSVISSNFEYVESAYELIKEIESVNEGKKNTLSYSSTSNLLPREVDAINKVYSLVEKLQISLVGEIKNLIYAGEEYKNLDQKLTIDIDRMGSVLSQDVQKYRVAPVALNTKDNEAAKELKLYTTNNLIKKSVYDRANLTAEEINMIIDSEVGNRKSVLKGTGEYWLKAAEKTGLDPLFLLALSRQESGLGTSEYAIDLNNYFGMKFQNGVQYFGYSKTLGSYVHRSYADTTEEGIMKAAEWIQKFYVEDYGGNTTLKFGYTGYNGGNNYGSVVSSIMARMKNTYEGMTGKTLYFIQDERTEHIPSLTYTSVSPASTYTSVSPVSAYTYGSSTESVSSASVTPITEPTIELVAPTKPNSPELIDITEPVSPSQFITKPTPMTESTQVTQSSSTIQSVTAPDSSSVIDSMPIPDSPATDESTQVMPPSSDQASIPNQSQNNNSNNNNNILNTIGVVGGVGLAAAAVAYGAEKIKESKENNEV